MEFGFDRNAAFRPLCGQNACPTFGRSSPRGKDLLSPKKDSHKLDWYILSFLKKTVILPFMSYTKPRLLKTFFLILISTGLAPVYGETKQKTLQLSEKEVLKIVLSTSPFIQKIKLENQKNLSQLQEIRYSLSQWNAFSSWNQSQKKNPEISFFESREENSKSFNLGLEKLFPYGLSLKSVYSDFNINQKHSDFLKRVQAPEQIYRKNFHIELKAGLQESLSQHWLLQNLQKGRESNDWLYYERAEELALQSAGQYWKTYLAWITYNQSKEGLQTYRQLVKQIQNKKRYGFLKPGERPQILAEYENIQQEVDKQEQNYKKEKQSLFLLLKRNPGEYNIYFKEEKPNPPPSFSKIDIEKIRTLKIKENQIHEQKLKLKSSQAKLFPNIQFLGKRGFIPGDANRENLSFSQKESFYELGFNIRWNLFSKSYYEKVNQEKYLLEEQKIDREILKQELKNQIQSIQKDILISYKNVNRSNRSNNYQKKAFKELKRSFDQGRVDIFELINTESKLRESEIRKKMALSDYSLLILQNLALRDQLVENYFKP